MFEVLLKKKKTIIFSLIILALILLSCRKTYYALILALFGIYAMVATSLDILFGYTGQISLGHAGLFAIGAYSTAILAMRAGFPTLSALISGTIITTFVGMLIAVPASKLVKHFLSLLMIAFGQIIYLIINSWISFTGGSLGIMYIPHLSLFGVSIDTNFKNAVVIWLLLGLVVFVKKQIVNSRVGDSFIAIRENPTAARGLGIDVCKYKITAFAISSAMTGLAGGLYAYLRGFISPETFNGTQSTLFMTMLLFGGITTVCGPIIGSCILLLIKELFQGFSNWQGLIYALFMLIVLFFFPKGIVGLFSDLRRIIIKKCTKKNADFSEEKNAED